MPNQTQNQADSTLLSIQERLASHQHRLVSLQISLNDAARFGEITPQQHEIRNKYLKEQLEHLKELRQWHAAEEASLTDESSLGLPNLDTCSPDEREICLQFLKARKQILSFLLSESMQVQKWVDQASQPSWLNVLAVFRLSKLKKILQRVEASISQLMSENTEIDQLTEQIARYFADTPDGEKIVDNIEAIVHLFQELDKIAANIALLKSQAQQKEENILQMRAWLQQFHNKIQRNFSAQSAPPIQKLQPLIAYSERSPSNPVKVAERRLTLAREYMEKSISSGTLPPVTGKKERRWT